MSDKNEPAFPCTVKCNTSSDPLATPRAIDCPGMTLRDYFAGQALAGFTSCALDDGDAVMGAADTARACYNYADALLIERERGQ